MNPAKTLFYRNWPIVVGLIAFILLAVWLDAHDRPAYLVKTHEERYRDFQGRTKQQYIVIEAGTSEQQLSHYEIVLGPRGEIKWKDLWKLRSKAEMTSKNTLAQTDFVNEDQEARFPEHFFLGRATPSPSSVGSALRCVPGLVPPAAVGSSPGGPKASRRGPGDGARRTLARSGGPPAGRATAGFHSPAARDPRAEVW